MEGDSDQIAERPAGAGAEGRRSVREIMLTEGWRLKERDPSREPMDDFALADGWLAATVPGTVHQDLLRAGRIADPFVGLEEGAAQWVGERDWLYRCSFDRPPGLAAGEAVALCCDGLDTIATVWLNGQEIGQSDNMFVPFRSIITSLLRPGQNELRLLFASALRVGQAREAEHGRRHVWNGDPSRVYVRKAQYHWGWDWGPCLLTAGPYLPVRLEVYTARIADLHCPVRVAADLQSATIPLTVMLDDGTSGRSDDCRVRVELFDPGGDRIAGIPVPAGDTTVRHTLTVAQPQLWWPRGYGEQSLYRLVVTLEDGTGQLDRREVRLGFRHLRLAQEPTLDAPGTGFVFVCNNTPIFCGGANWIPADSLLPRITPHRYRDLLQQAADANMVMLRVWGGGVYEAEAFYDACDELGLLVWQDFMFACGMYPALPWFQASVRAEAEAAVRRLRHHACLALWCGNNEDYQVAESLRAYDPAGSDDLAVTPFPGRALYEQVLPAVCGGLDPDHAYWPGSPYGGTKTVNEPTTGDRHVWDVWHGSMAEYGQYARLGGRFVSEFGMQAVPELATVEAFAPPEERFGQSRTLEFHNKAGGGARRLAVYLADTVRTPRDFPGYIYATQLVQAEALSAAYRDWRRRWDGTVRAAVAGALVWQLDDCWPGTSWSIIDYFGRLKPASYLIRRALAPVAVGMALTDGTTAVWGLNGGRESVAATLELRTWTLDGDLLATEQREVVLSPNSATEFGTLPPREHPPVVQAARLLTGGTVLARTSLWPEPLKYLTLPDPEIRVTRRGERLLVTAKRPAKGVVLAAGDGVRWSDNMLDLQPDDEQVIEAKGLADATVTIRRLST
jgi:beta-mannosidase